VRISAIFSDSRRVGRIAGLWAGLAAAVAAAPAYAVLGGAPMTPPAGASVSNAVGHAAASAGASTAASGATSSVMNSATMAQSASAATTTAAYTVRTTTLAGGTVVNEYMGADGVVFGIAWHGPRIPDLSTLLGSYFPQYVQGIQAQRANGAGRGPVGVVGSGLVVRSAGHMGAFAGHAYLPQALPAGVTGGDIH
jgi:Protein of unknown function (DUF2844)